MSHRRRNLGIVAAVAAFIGASCGSGSNAPDGDRAIADLPVQAMQTTEMSFGDLQNFVAFSDAVIIGTGVEVRPGPTVAADASEDPGTSGTRFEMLSVNVDESLTGNLTRGQRIEIASPSLLLRDGEPVSRIEPYVAAAEEPNLQGFVGERFVMFLKRQDLNGEASWAFASSVGALAIDSGRVAEPRKKTESPDYVEKLIGRSEREAASTVRAASS